MPVDSSRDPDSMTADERRDEVASILARGLVWSVRAARTRMSAPTGILEEGAETCLDLSAETRLSVAPRPAG